MGRLSPEIMARAREMVALYPQARSAFLPVCHLVQAEDGWLSPEAMEDIASLLGISPADVLGTASFYDMLHTRPLGKWLVGVCTNIACLLNGGEELLVHASERLGIQAGSTTSDGRFTLEELECIAACDRAPCLTINWRLRGPVSHQAFDTLVEDLAAGRLDGEIPPHGVLNRVGRKGGLAVPAERVRTERAASDRSLARRREQAAEAEQVAKAAGAADQAATEAVVDDKAPKA